LTPRAFRLHFILMFAIFNPIVAILFNEKLQRWHPIYFREAPLPGGSGPARHKSGGHHTVGFMSRQEALDSATKLAEDIKKECSADSTCKVSLAEDIHWDGEDVPAIVAFFADAGDGTVKRVL
jgi:hypothetical protein